MDVDLAVGASAADIPPTPVRGKASITLQVALYGYPCTDGHESPPDATVLQGFYTNAMKTDESASARLDEVLRDLHIQLEHLVSQPWTPLPLLEIDAIRSYCDTVLQTHIHRMLARRQLRRLLGHNHQVFDRIPMPPMRTSNAERILIFCQSLCQLISHTAKRFSVVPTCLSLEHIVELITNVCASFLPNIVDSVLSVLAFQPFSSMVWADCIVRVLFKVFGPSNRSYMLQRRSVLQALKQIAKATIGERERERERTTSADRRVETNIRENECP